MKRIFFIFESFAQTLALLLAQLKARGMGLLIPFILIAVLFAIIFSFLAKAGALAPFIYPLL